MSIMKITMLGLEMALSPEGKSIFDLLELPEGIDKDTVTDNIILEGGDFEVLYADPYMFRMAVGTWARKHLRTFEKWINALNIEYNPLENYDRKEDWTDSGTKNSKTTGSGTNGETNSGSVGNSGTNTVETTVSAFDSGSYQPSDKTTETPATTTTSSNTLSGSFSNSEELHEGDKQIHDGRIHGNIGVTTSQQMLQSELDIARFNLVQQITDLFLTEFTLMIYD